MLLYFIFAFLLDRHPEVVLGEGHGSIFDLEVVIHAVLARLGKGALRPIAKTVVLHIEV